MKSLNAEVNEGRFLSSALLDARKESPTLSAKVSTEGLDIGYLLENLAEVDMLKGSLNSELQLTSSGSDTNTLQKNMQATFSADSEEMRIVPIDLLKNVCETVAFVEGKPLANQNWNAFTKLSPIKLNANVKNEKLSLSEFSAKVEKFDALASGRFNLSDLSFDFPIELSLSDFAAELEGCNFISDEWRKKSLPLRCKGNISDVGVKTCQPNYSHIREKWKNKAKEKAKAKVEAEKERAKERVEEKIKEKLRDKVKEEDIDRLKDLFRR